VLKLSDGVSWPTYVKNRRKALFEILLTSKAPKVSIMTDGVTTKLVGEVEVEKTPWLSKHSSPDVVLIAGTLIKIAARLGIEFQAELLGRIKEKKLLKGQAAKDFRVLDTRAVWNYIKDATPYKLHQWAEQTACAANVDRAQACANTSPTYTQIQRDREAGVEWCRESGVTGMVPSFVLAAIRGPNMNQVVANYVDPGLKNFLAGVWRYVDKATGEVWLIPHRITGAYYHHRVGLNRVREQEEQRGNMGKSWDERMSLDKARQRRLVEEGKRQLTLEILAGWRIAADRLGDGRDYVVIVEHGSSGDRGGSRHRKPATNEFIRSFARFVSVGTTSGFMTSQCCSRCGEHLEYANKPREIRSKCCSSEACMAHTSSEEPRAFHVDRDINAAVNFCLIDEAEAGGEGRPERFQSLYYPLVARNSVD
jgi:hypothetical protein